MWSLGMDCGCLSISWAVCLALTVHRQAWTRDIDSDRLNPDFWLVCRGIQRPLLLFDQLIDLLTLARWTCVPEFNFRIHFSETCVYRNDVESVEPSEGLRVEAKYNCNLDAFPLIVRYLGHAWPEHWSTHKTFFSCSFIFNYDVTESDPGLSLCVFKCLISKGETIWDNLSICIMLCVFLFIFHAIGCISPFGLYLSVHLCVILLL